MKAQAIAQASHSCRQHMHLVLVRPALNLLIHLQVGQFRVTHSDDEWRQLLTPAQYSVLRRAGTELPFSSPLNKVHWTQGVYSSC